MKGKRAHASSTRKPTTSKPAPQPVDSFSAAEARIAVSRQRLPNFPAQLSTLTRLGRHINKLSQESANLALRPHSLNLVAYNTLMMLYGTADDRLSPSQLADASGEKRTNITRICDELTEQGLIARVAGVDDRRSVVVSLTRRGIQLIESLQPVMTQLLRQMYSDFSAVELRELQRLLRKQLAQLDRSLLAATGRAT